MQIRRSTTIQADPDQVWKVLGQGFTKVDSWASSVHVSAGLGTPNVPGAPTAGRTCQTDLGPFREAIVEFDEEKRILAYTASGEKMPFFVKGLRNHWALSPSPGSGTRLDMLMTAELAFPFNFLMTPIMKLQMGKVLTYAVEELKYFVEKGKPHPRKREAVQNALATA